MEVGKREQENVYAFIKTSFHTFYILRKRALRGVLIYDSEPITRELQVGRPIFHTTFGYTTLEMSLYHVKTCLKTSKQARKALLSLL